MLGAIDFLLDHIAQQTCHGGTNNNKTHAAYQTQTCYKNCFSAHDSIPLSKFVGWSKNTPELQPCFDVRQTSKQAEVCAARFLIWISLWERYSVRLWKSEAGIGTASSPMAEIQK